MKFPAFEPIELKNDLFKIIELPTSKIIADINQPRKNFNEESLNDLAASIKQHGIIQPIIVKKLSHLDKYQIIAGERRWRAANIAQLKIIPVIIRDDEDEAHVAVSIIENIQREELNPIELAEALNKLSTNYGLSHEAIAALVGKNRTTITNLLRLLNLSNYAKENLINGKLEMSHAKTLLTLPHNEQIEIVDKIIKMNLTVRDTEKLVQLCKLPKEMNNNFYTDMVSEWVRKLSESLSSKVSIKINDKGEGKVVIYFESPEEVERLIEQVELE